MEAWKNMQLMTLTPFQSATVLSEENESTTLVLS